MTGAELLALARHTLPDASDDHIALHLAFALKMLWPQLTDGQCSRVSCMLQQLVADDMIRRNVRNDYSNLQARTNS